MTESTQVDFIVESLLIIGCGGHSKVVTEIAESQGCLDIKYLDSSGTCNTFLGRQVIHSQPVGYDGAFFVAIGDNSLRQEVALEFLACNPRATLISLVHPTSVVSEYSFIGKGVVVMPLCVVNHSSVISDGVILNTSSIVDHDCSLDVFSSLAPGVSLGGGVNVGARSAISIGSTVKHGVNIGNDVVVGANALVLSDLGDSCVVYGLPAKKIRDRRRGDKYL